MTSMTTLKVGDVIEFWSSAGYWKPGVIDRIINWKGSVNVRVCVGKGVHIIRRLEAIRLSMVGRCLHAMA